MKILLTSAQWLMTYAVMKDLAKDGHEVTLISFDRNLASLHSKYCKNFLIAPEEKRTEEFTSFVIDALKKDHYDCLIPISDAAVDCLGAKTKEILPLTKMALPSTENIHLARDKKATYKYCLAHAIPIPQTYFPEHLNDLNKLRPQIDFPCYIKKGFTTGGKGNTVVHSWKELENYYRQIPPGIDFPVIQKKIDGRLFGMTAICHDGKILDRFMFDVYQQYPEKGGVSVYSRSYLDPELERHAENLIRSINYSGAIDLDYTKDEKGQYLLFEINPRLSGTTLFGLHCGVHLPRAYLKLIMGEPGTCTLSTYRAGRSYRCIMNELLLCKNNKKFISRFILNTFNLLMFSDLSIADPKYYYWQIKNIFWTLTASD